MLGGRIVRDASTLVTWRAVMSAWLDEEILAASQTSYRAGNGPVVPSLRALQSLCVPSNRSKRAFTSCVPCILGFSSAKTVQFALSRAVDLPASDGS